MTTTGVCDLTETRGVKLFYEITGPFRKQWKGDNEVFTLLILGSVADLRKKGDRGYVNLLSQCLKVLTYDHRNTGRSDKKDEPLTMMDYADDAAALLQSLAPEQTPAHVIGVSFGGMVAMHLAIRHPKLVKKLVLCCTAGGGEGGMPFPIHEWYQPEVTIEERVWKRMSMANSDRDEKWAKENESMYKAMTKMMTDDEKIDAEDPLRDKGILRQLEARQAHDVWNDLDKLKEGGREVIVLGSTKDQIAPPELVEKLAEKIGCEAKLDFGWGHPFLAADETAAPWVNDWLRKAPEPTWEIVGGGDAGGIIVRRGAETDSAQADKRLATGARVKEMERQGNRLRYRLVQGTGPEEGWISVKLKDKDLAVKV